MKTIRSIYKITSEQADVMRNIGNETGFHIIVVDYGYGLCINIPPESDNYELIRQYITKQGLVSEDISLDIPPLNNPFTYAVEWFNETVNSAKSEVIKNTRNKLLNVESISQDEIDLIKPIYQNYEIGMKMYGVETTEHPITIFTYNNRLWKVIQDHTSQSDWLPDKTPALYLEIAPTGVIPVWKQPAGAHDTYQKGDKVHFPTINDQVYESLIDANVWSPTEYPQGWEKL